MVIQPLTSGSKYGNTPGKTGPLQLGTYSKKVSVHFFSLSFLTKVQSQTSYSPCKPRPLLPRYMHTYICRNSWRSLHQHIHTSHHRSTHGSLYQHDRRHRDTLTELFGHSHLLFLQEGPFTCTQPRHPIKGVIPLWKPALVTKIHKYESIHTHWNVCTSDTLLAQKSIKSSNSKINI